MSEHVASRGYPDVNEVRRTIVREMNRVGAYRAEGEYSGGHDEGGLDILTLYDKKGEKIELAGDRWDHPLHSAIQDLLNTKFYSWALGMYVHGHVYVDLKERRAWTEGYEEVTSYEDDADPIDMRW